MSSTKAHRFTFAQKLGGSLSSQNCTNPEKRQMKLLDSFGAFVLDTFYWWVAFFAIVGGGLYLFNQPPTVRLSAKEFKCSMTVPDGIGAKCVEYVSKETIGK